MYNKIKKMNKYNIFSIIAILIIFFEFMLIPALYPVSTDDLKVIGLATTGHFFHWNSRLGETIATKILDHIPWIISYLLMGLSYIVLMISGFYLAIKRLPNLTNIKEVLSLSIIIYLMAFYYYTYSIITIVAWYANYTLSLISLIAFAIPLYNFLNEGKLNIKRIKLYYLLLLLTAWSHEIIALFSFIIYAYVISYSLIKRIKLPKWFYGLILPWLIGAYLVSIGGLNRMKSTHDNLANKDILGFLKEQKISEAIMDAFTGYPQNTYILTVLICIVISLVFHYVSTRRLKNFVLFEKWHIFLLDFIMLISFSVSNYIFLHSTKKIAYGAVNFLLFFTFVICVRLLVSLNLKGLIFKLIAYVLIVIALLLPISAIYSAYYMKLQRDALILSVEKQVKLGIKDIKVFQEYEPKHIMTKLGIFIGESGIYIDGAVITEDAKYWLNTVFVDYYNYHNAPNRYSYKHNPIINSISAGSTLENPILNVNGELKR